MHIILYLVGCADALHLQLYRGCIIFLWNKALDQSSKKMSSTKEMLNEKHINAHSMASFAIGAFHAWFISGAFDRTPFWEKSSPNTTKISLAVRHYKTLQVLFGLDHPLADSDVAKWTGLNSVELKAFLQDFAQSGVEAREIDDVELLWVVRMAMPGEKIAAVVRMATPGEKIADDSSHALPTCSWDGELQVCSLSLSQTYARKCNTRAINLSVAINLTSLVTNRYMYLCMWMACRVCGRWSIFARQHKFGLSTLTRSKKLRTSSKILTQIIMVRLTSVNCAPLLHRIWQRVHQRYCNR